MSRFDALDTFVAVVEAGSFTAAAERLRIAKSVVSRRISDLESRLGARLVNRTTRRLSLTDAGRTLYGRAIRVLADLEEAEASVSRDQGALQGPLRVAAPLSFGLWHLGPALSGFLADNPGLTLDLSLEDRQINLVEEGYDLALRIARLEDSNLVARKLAPIRLVACASPGYLERHGEPDEPEQLTAHAGLFYGYLTDSQNWPYLGANGRPVGPRVPARMRANNGDVLLQAAQDGLGITVLPTFIAWRPIRQGRLKRVLPGHPLPESALHAVYSSRRHLPERVRALVDFLAERYSGEPYWDQLLNEVAPATN